MAGTVLDRELTARRKSRVRFAVATAADDADIRRLLRETPMRGHIRVTLEREPDYFADAHQPGESRHTIVAREGETLACAGSCAVRSRFVNGTAFRVGYLGGLRLSDYHAGRADLLRRGYAFFRDLQTANPADYYFTSIAADNERARRFLEASIPGMPRYEFIGEFVTLFIASGYGVPPSGGRAQSHPRVLRTPSPLNLANAPPAEAGTPNSGKTTFEELAARGNDHNRHYQFAPCWSAGELVALEPLGLRRDDFCCVREGRRLAAGAALWDQRAYKQTVVRGYSPVLSAMRPLLNLLASVLRQPRLPAVGRTLRSAVVSHLTAASDRPAVLKELLNQLRRRAAERELETLMLGFDTRDPRLAIVRRAFRAREYRSRLYVVRWPELGGPATELDGRPAAPELALL